MNAIGDKRKEGGAGSDIQAGKEAHHARVPVVELGRRRWGGEEEDLVRRPTIPSGGSVMGRRGVDSSLCVLVCVCVYIVYVRSTPVGKAGQVAGMWLVWVVM